MTVTTAVKFRLVAFGYPFKYEYVTVFDVPFSFVTIDVGLLLLLYEYVTFLYGDDPDIGVVFTDVSSPLSLYSDTVFVSDELFKQVFVIFILEFENVYSL